MYFWINKPAGRYYGFTDRRYPATPLPKTRFNRCQYNADLRQMVTPLRFQNLNVMENAAGPSNVNNCRVIQTTIRTNNETQNSLPVDSTQHPQLNNISNNVTTAGNNQLILSNSTSNRTNRSLLDFPEINDAERASCRVRAVLSIFMVATAFVTAAIKFYFGDGFLDREIFVFWGLLILLLNACLYPILCCRNRRNNHQEHQIQEEHIASVNAAMPNENIRPISVVSHNPPPPYHIAILIPPHNTSDEAPPPSYDKVMR